MYELELVTYSSNLSSSESSQHDEEQTTQFCGKNKNFSSSSVSEVLEDSLFQLDHTWENLDKEDFEEDWRAHVKQLNMNPGNRSSQSSSTFYIDLKERGEDEKDGGEVLEPVLLPGEHCIAQAHRVVSYSTVAGLTSGVSGSLFVTTLKLSLRLHLESDQGTSENLILGHWDVPLTSIYAIYEISGETGDKKKKLTLGSTVNTKIDAVFILCKNFRFLQFNFKFAKIDQGRSVVNALLHHVRPKKSSLLFAFEQKKKYHSFADNQSQNCDWESIVDKSGSKDVRITRVNESWQVCTNLPQQFIVPNHVNDDQVARISGLFTGSRAPVWVWGVPDHGALFIQSQLNVMTSLVTDQLRKDFYGVHVGRKIREVDLTKVLPAQSVLEEAYPAMLDLHCVDNERDSDKSDYFSKLESIGWLNYVSSLLRTATDVCEILCREETAVLIDLDGRGPAIVVASLVQIFQEPEFRSRSGFELLIQNNWVSLGYPFSGDNLICAKGVQTGGTTPSNSSSMTPYFLIFLDCIHQLILQFPSLFEFRSVYLLDLLDTSFLPIFDTFIFDSEHDRHLAHRNPETPLNPSPAWHWQVQFTNNYIKTWQNPLYKIPRRPVRLTSQDPTPYSQIMGRQIHPTVPENKSYLPVDYYISGLSVWTELFHRSVPFLQVSSHPHKVLLKKQIQAREEIELAERKQQQLETGGVPRRNETHHHHTQHHNRQQDTKRRGVHPNSGGGVGRHGVTGHNPTRVGHPAAGVARAGGGNGAFRTN
eukprot:TRINITY_DN22964_c0_g1_i2.p1 TRINITY_DN22964_c0_g1~~TRINITY_DN22964_c0_g1_i2.p1  ORF type:complete len:760 (-),score=125.48 TRINITY_DN22964_c0_g1_i2:175-2454(-)